MMKKIINWLKSKILKQKRRELIFLTWRDADHLIRQTNGAWTIAREEDNNTNIGMVWLERRQYE